MLKFVNGEFIDVKVSNQCVPLAMGLWLPFDWWPFIEGLSRSSTSRVSSNENMAWVWWKSLSTAGLLA